MNKVNKIRKELFGKSDSGRAGYQKRFFKNDNYGRDKIIGVSMPDIRKLAKEFSNLEFSEILELLESEIHEERMLALVMLSERGKKAWKNKDGKELTKVTKFYLKHKKHIDNWDLVDVSTHYILGYYILMFPEERGILEKLSSSKNLWDRRIAMVSNWTMIREGKYDETFYLAEKLLDDKEDLMHKATGWMLREVWKKQPEKVEAFLIKHYDRVHRTTLRYTIEWMKGEKRKKFLKGNF